MNRRQDPLTRTLVCTLCALALATPVATAGQLLGTDVWAASLGEIDRDSAAWAEIGPTYIPMHGLTYDGVHGILYGISAQNDNLYEINPLTGAASQIGAPGSLGYDNANGLAYDSNNNLIWGTDNNTNELFTVDPRTGVATRAAIISGGFTEIEGLGFDPATDTLYGLTQLQRRVVRIDTRTGEATAVSDVLPDLVWRGLAYDPEYRVLQLSAVTIFEDADLYSFDPVGGRLDYRGAIRGAEAVQGLAFVPEPSTALLCLALLPLAATRRGR